MNEYRDDAVKETPVRGFLHRPAEADGDSLILTHGAGANCNAPVLIALADAFCASGLTVLRAAICPSANCVPAGHRLAAALSAINRGSPQQLRPCGSRLRAGYFSAVILTEEDSHPCWQRINPGWSMLSCCCPTHCIRQNGLSSCGPRTSLTFEPQRCS